MPASSLTFEVLNATADDWESLEHIYPQVNEHWRVVEPAVVAEEMFRLLETGMFEVMPKAPLHAGSIQSEPIEYWFRMTPAGRTQWEKLAKELGLED